MSGRKGMRGQVVLEGFPAPGDWVLDAACRGLDPNIFFPEKYAGPAPCAQAKAICAACLVIVDCRDYAVANPAIRGVWGGLTVRERLAIRRKEAA